jgi:hypothetical protein
MRVDEITVLHIIEESTLQYAKSSALLYITPSSLVKVNRHFRGTYHIHLQGRRISQARNKYGAGRRQSTSHAEKHNMQPRKEPESQPVRSHWVSLRNRTNQ